MDKDTIFFNSINLILFESKYYFALITQFLLTNETENKKPRYGAYDGYSSLISPLFSQDMSVFVYEFIKFLKYFNVPIKEYYEDFSEDFFNRLKVVRHNIHLYNTKGSYKEKGMQIIYKQLFQFGLDKWHFLNFLKKDISIIYKIADTKKILLGTDYTSKHIFEENRTTWSGKQRKQFAYEISYIITKLSQSIKLKFEQGDELPNMDILRTRPFQIELFDCKSSVIFSDLPLSKITAFRILLILTSISYASCIIEIHIDQSKVTKDIGWLCFLTKWIAIKYDEAFDSLQNLLKYIDEEEKTIINLKLKEYNIDLCKLKYRSVARKLRNMLHYSKNETPLQKDSEGTIIVDIFHIYAINSGLANTHEFNDAFLGIQTELHKLEICLRSLFNNIGKKIARSLKG